jgi:hypothetical protein
LRTRQCVPQRQSAQDDEDQPGNDAHCLRGESIGKAVAEIDHRYVRDQHRKRGTADDGVELLETGRQSDRRNLGLVAHLCDEKSHGGCAVYAHPKPRLADLARIEPVRNQDPPRHQREGCDDGPVQHGRTQRFRKPGSEAACGCVIDQCRCQHAQHDRKRLAVARGQDQRKQLCLVSDFGQRDNAGGYDEGLQHGMPGGRSLSRRVRWCRFGGL